MTNAIAVALPIHGEAVRRASGFVLVAKGRAILAVAARQIHRRCAVTVDQSSVGHFWSSDIICQVAAEKIGER